MSASTEIAWTSHTFNPWWGCARVSAGCEHCYAETFAHRLGRDLWGRTAERRTFGDAHWAEPLAWARRAARDGVRRRVFCASMADILEDRHELDEHRQRLWRLIDATPELDWQLLTKRPENARALLPALWLRGEWPDHAWLGVTAEDQAAADRRVPLLLAIQGPRVRFVSYEPALGPIDLRRWLGPDRVSWVICGGESGAGARPHEPAWSLRVVTDCLDAGVQPFVKQLGARPTTGRLHDAKGADPNEWPAALRVRRFPPA